MEKKSQVNQVGYIICKRKKVSALKQKLLLDYIERIFSVSVKLDDLHTNNFCYRSTMKLKGP